MRETANGGKLIVLTAPLTETIDHGGFFMQMGVASMPKRLEGNFNTKYPNRPQDPAGWRVHTQPARG